MRLLWFFVFLVVGLVLILTAWLVPAHFRALDAKVIERAGTNTTSLVEEGLNLVRLEKIGPAWMLLQAAQKESLPGAERLALAVEQFGKTNPEVLRWGGADPYLEQLFRDRSLGLPLEPRPIMDFLIARKPRELMLGFLLNSRRPGVQEILETGGLTNTVLFPPVNSPAGQPLDAAILITALLSQEDRLAPPLRDEIESLAAQANRGADLKRLELIYLDLFSLGKRLSWVQLAEFVKRIQDPGALSDLANLARSVGDHMPVLYSAVHLSESPVEVAKYLKRFGKTGFGDLSFSLRGGVGSLRELLETQQRVHYPKYRDKLASITPVQSAVISFAQISREAPALGISLKYLFLLVGGFCLARSIKYWGPPPSSLDRYLEVRGMSTTRQIMFALALLLFAVAFGEPFLAQASQKLQFPRVQLVFPMAGEAIRATLSSKLTPMIDQLTILALVMFLVIQGLIYAFGLLKLAEIRRQPVSSPLKLKLLENEDTLFDAGLYVGLGGTVASLVFLVMGVIKPSLMAAYSSTLFGIIFVAVLKIFHVRPYRRQLILESEMQPELPAELPTT